MVETALVLPVVALLLFGILDFGWLFYNKLQVENCAREGARYAAVSYDVSSAAASEADIINYVNTELRPNNLTFVITVTPTAHSNGDVNGYLTVAIDTNVRTFTPLIGAFFPGGVCHMEASCTMHREKP